jgi:ABC-type transport system involved in cytochrome bd biosynthesis fused ATPase/permease subunit
VQTKAIARAVYSKKSMVILDDVFSGMDAATEHLVFNRLLGSEGLLRNNGATVIIATHAGQSLSSNNTMTTKSNCKYFSSEPFALRRLHHCSRK